MKILYEQLLLPLNGELQKNILVQNKLLALCSVAARDSREIPLFIYDLFLYLCLRLLRRPMAGFTLSIPIAEVNMILNCFAPHSPK